MPLPPNLLDRLRLPLIAAPMFLISGPELVMAACRSGIIGSFPTQNARTPAILETWLSRLASELGDVDSLKGPPWAVNVVVHSSYTRMVQDLELVLAHRVPIVITALGSPGVVVDAVHEYGGLVFADVNSVPFARKAAAAGVDGLVLVCSGAGGHTGRISHFAFLPAVREFWTGPIILAGAVGDGRAVRACEILGADLVYMGTRFIAVAESMATDGYRKMLIEATVDDIVCTDAFTGVPANMLRPSIVRAGLDPDRLQPKEIVDFGDPQGPSKAWKDIWSAGQGVGAISDVTGTASLVDQLEREYQAAAAVPVFGRGGDPDQHET